MAAMRVCERAIQIGQDNHRDCLDREQQRLAGRAFGLEPAVADAGVPGQHQVEKRRDPDRAAAGDVEHEQQPEFCRLIEEQHGDGRDKAGAEVGGHGRAANKTPRRPREGGDP